MVKLEHRPLTLSERVAVDLYAYGNGRRWKSKLSSAWMSGGNEEGTYGILRSLRNTHGPGWLRTYRPELRFDPNRRYGL